jgi:hypothetical protein
MRRLTCCGRADSSSLTTVGPSGPSECRDFGLGVADRRKALQRDQPQFERKRAGPEEAGVVAGHEADLHETHEMRKRLRRGHVRGGRQIAQG